MTRAVVANLNRQKSANNGATASNSGTASQHEGTPTTSPTASPSRTPKSSSPQKSLPPQPSKNRVQSKQLPEVPEFYIVRPAPSTSAAKVERNDRRVFINRGTMERMNAYQGSVVLIQRHYPSELSLIGTPEPEGHHEDDGNYPSDEEEDNIEQTAVGIVWPMDRIEPSGIPRWG